jgi:polyphosphate kinase
VKGISDNINVTSIVGRFLEHSRIFYFENAGDPLVYLGSADLMPRNLYRRVEVVFPILCPALRKHVIDDILHVFLADRVKARKLLPDGTYTRLKPAAGEKPFAAQLTFREQVRRQNASLSVTDPCKSGELTPLRAV